MEDEYQNDSNQEDLDINEEG